MTKRVVEFTPREYKFDFSDGRFIKKMQNDAPAELDYLAQYCVDDQLIAASLGDVLEPLLADWIEVAASVYFADRLALRRDRLLPRSYHQWGRIIHLKLAVRRPDVWQRTAICDALCDLLYFLTGDKWRFEFVPRHERKNTSKHNVQGLLFPAHSSRLTRIALYSGGLDSFVGAAQQLSENRNLNLILVSAVTNSRQQAGQRKQVRGIADAVKAGLTHITVPVRRRLRDAQWAEEDSQRARGFLFLTLGSVTALAAGSHELHIYENGIGAINLPINATQVGAYNSRAVNPITLIHMAEFVKTLVGKNFAIINPFLLSTKGEMCQHPVVRKLAPFIAETFSCDGFPVQVQGRPQCGTCTSCLLRRVSLCSADLSEFDFGYLVDLLSDTATASKNQLFGFRAMYWQAQQFKQALASENQWNAMVSYFPRLRRVEETVACYGRHNHSELQFALLRLYERYVSEWEGFAAKCFVLNKQVA